MGARAKVTSRVSGDGHPFLFYGRRPDDWFEGANDGHFYELRFRTAAEGKARAAVARAFEGKLRGSAVDSAPIAVALDRRVGALRGR